MLYKQEIALGYLYIAFTAFLAFKTTADTNTLNPGIALLGIMQDCISLILI